MGKLSKARQRGLYPERMPGVRFDKQVLVTISLKADLYDWLTELVGGHSNTMCVEDAIQTALRCMRGDGNLNSLAGIVASQRQGISRIEAILGEIEDEDPRRAAGLLYVASFMAARRGRRLIAEDVLPRDEKDRTAED